MGLGIADQVLQVGVDGSDGCATSTSAPRPRIVIGVKLAGSCRSALTVDGKIVLVSTNISGV
ncbi:MAG: hypothetical protein IPI73_26725 [Betaproteobacteria bacterium]|nr:hypothetical protein [Betaproteobacteria bacterium]